MAGIWLRRAADRTEAEHRALTRLLELAPEASLAFNLCERFTSLLRESGADALEPWLEEAATNGLPEFRSFATGVQRDKVAILAAISLPYSNGQTEGQATKLKLLKRSDLNADAIDEIQNVASTTHEAAPMRTLGALLQREGLRQSAATQHMQALARAEEIGDVDPQAQLQEDLGLVGTIDARNPN